MLIGPVRISSSVPESERKMNKACLPAAQLQTADAEAPLPNGVADGKEERKLKHSSSFARALGPTMVCVYALLVLKTAQQGFVDSLPLITVRCGCPALLGCTAP